MEAPNVKREFLSRLFFDKSELVVTTVTPVRDRAHTALQNW
ncbi:hypothetical protein SBA1_290011 [Candidatus Sulfotelmatobacter kueseliae]|uniref:Uncharacterized protein n=1 Tax=Candidatus Sulfotelmatobacter kueseliae TaxID=2042962 RepID=A0A2U3KIZ4_9BACT|nr:hypothetical protein SBA1_290011 [Candidatus Sulfotelmatobacter kueseliae]